MKEGIRHLIECHCFLPQYRNRKDPVFHKFVVFSELQSDVVEEKTCQCNNCGILHRVTDICKSEILTGREEHRALISIADIKISFPPRLAEMLDAYSCDLPIWEHVEFILREKKWGERIKLSSQESEDEVQSKFLKIRSRDEYGIVVESGRSVVEIN